MKFSQKIFENWRFWKMAILKNRPFWIFFFRIFFFRFIFLKISPNLYGRMDRLKFWRFPWFPANSLLCVIKRNTVYEWILIFLPCEYEGQIAMTDFKCSLNFQLSDWFVVWWRGVPVKCQICQLVCFCFTDFQFQASLSYYLWMGCNFTRVLPFIDKILACV